MAIQHDNHGNLLDPKMYPLMVQSVLPLLDADSVIVMEGGKKRGELGPGSENYEKLFRQLGPAVYFSGKKPLIYSDDPMYSSGKSNREITKQLALSDGFHNAVSRFLILRDQPQTWMALVEKIRSDNHTVEIIGSLPRKWRKYAREAAKEFRIRDKAFASQIEQYARRGKNVFFIGGVVHCMELARHFDYPVIMYNCGAEVIECWYFTWFQAYKIAGILKS